MKRTRITVEAINHNGAVFDTCEMFVDAENGWHGVITLKIKDNVLVDADAPVQKIKFKRIKG